MRYESIYEAIQNTTKAHHSELYAIAGEVISGDLVEFNLSDYSHITVSGVSGAGKSTLLHTIVLSLIGRYSAEDVKILFFSTKSNEYSMYGRIPHLLFASYSDAFHIAASLQWLYEELESRYELFHKAHVRCIEEYNAKSIKPTHEALARIVVIIDELNGLPDQEIIQSSLIEMIRLGTTAGIHLIVATQNALTKRASLVFGSGLPLRAVFSISSPKEKKVLFEGHNIPMPQQFGTMTLFDSVRDRGQSILCYDVTDFDISSIIGSLECVIPPTLQIITEPEVPPVSAVDKKISDAVNFILATQQASISMLQRRMKMGYAECARLMDQLEELGFVGPFCGDKPRKILITKEQWNKMYLYNPNTIRENTMPQNIVSVVPREQPSPFTSHEPIETTQDNNGKPMSRFRQGWFLYGEPVADWILKYYTKTWLWVIVAAALAVVLSGLLWLLLQTEIARGAFAALKILMTIAIWIAIFGTCFRALTSEKKWKKGQGSAIGLVVGFITATLGVNFLIDKAQWLMSLRLVKPLIVLCVSIEVSAIIAYKIYKKIHNIPRWKLKRIMSRFIPRN